MQLQDNLYQNQVAVSYNGCATKPTEGHDQISPLKWAASLINDDGGGGGGGGDD